MEDKTYYIADDHVIFTYAILFHIFSLDSLFCHQSQTCILPLSR